MANKERVKMPIHERAKQFAPFSPLKGLARSLAQKERLKVLVDKKIVSEDMAAENDRVLRAASVGDMVEAVYYDSGEYIKKRGLVSEISAEKKFIKIVETPIFFEDLFEIKAD